VMSGLEAELTARLEDQIALLDGRLTQLDFKSARGAARRSAGGSAWTSCSSSCRCAPPVPNTWASDGP
jgi:hypothetical protein